MRVAEVLARIGQHLGGEVDEARIIQVVLDGGRILALGSHQELIKSCPLYLRLHEAHLQKRVA